jgi:hypothetical protein
MKALILFTLCCLVFASVLGCQTPQSTKTTEGALVGGLIGATGGGIIGQQSHHGAEGAAIGLAAGAVAGALIGSQMSNPGQPAQPAQQFSNPNQVTVQQVVDLTRQGVNEAVIIDKIRITNSRFTLTQADLDYLKQQGVSQNVINAMQGVIK